MDRLTRHKAIVRQLVEDIAQMTPSDEQSETQLIIDDERGHYVLFSVGWPQGRRSTCRLSTSMYGPMPRFSFSMMVLT